MKILHIEIKDGVPPPPPRRNRVKSAAWNPPGRPGILETLTTLEPGQCAMFDTASPESARVITGRAGEITGNRYTFRHLGEGDGPGVSRVGVWRIDGTEYDLKRP